MRHGCTSFQNLTRRDFFRIGGVGLFGLSAPTLLEARAANPRARQMIILWLGGGPPHIDMFDMKPDAPAEVRGPWKPIATKLPGLQVSELMPNLARSADKYTVLRSVNAKGYPDEGQHGAGAAWSWLTANRRDRRSNSPKFPAYGSVLAKVRPGSADLPGFVTFGDIGRESYLGPAYEPIEFKLDDPADRLTTMLAPAPMDITALDRRTELLKSAEQHLRRLDKEEPLIAGLDRFQQQAVDLLRSPKLREAIDLKREPTKSAERYGKGAQCRRVLAARRLIEAGVPCVHVQFHGFIGWDFHGGQGTFAKAVQLISEFDTACAALLEDLEQRGLLDSTIVYAGGEMGRSPKPESTVGSRNHWNDAQSILVAGGGFRRGCVVGATDKNGAYVTDKHYTVASLGRTFYELLGIDADQELYTPDKRPVKIVGEDAPLIKEALA